MSFHPASLMLLTWAVSLIALLILPFNLYTRSFSAEGFAITMAFIGIFALGSVLASPAVPKRPFDTRLTLNWTGADRLLKAAALVSLAAIAVELGRRNFLDLAQSYVERSERVTAMMYGEESQSSIAFQVAFLTYPAGFTYIVRQLGFEAKPKLLSLALFGFAPVIGASLIMGGRSPLLIGIALMALTIGIRRNLFIRAANSTRRRRRNPVLLVLIALTGLVSVNYFAQVFIIRAEASGGVEQAFDSAAAAWGVGFDGPGAQLLSDTIGQGNTYLLFVFIWYMVQGVLMANVAFTDYSGPPHYGVYGIDMVTAIVRRLNGEFVADRFLALQDINIYGFFPSAFGTLFIDYGLTVGFIVTFVWGWAAGAVYRRSRQGLDQRWLLAAPFVTLGVVFSLINTPIGFSNGLLIYFWLILAFWLVRSRRGPERG